ncbi:MAG: multifunctional oxoglutarate decarboxylase/oxoglutarate dehydrogenase thiamine pyrophosphate-binding subunit/dihydrolipoyllysine-residue succinyltransferase subunit [Actinomycetaceae bacterium]|nr:multifunctional oxoglutarate decarboxylase/oxoglutarate dehydrogenase thiamine pyrophosphate-binding subunit/dihydrolipoyllysine-residue succinyltransferase subunit [Actinomycetaceae bacterium]
MATASSSDTTPEVSQEFINELYDQFRADPAGVPQDWQEYFKQMEDLGLLPEKDSDTGHSPKSTVPDTDFAALQAQSSSESADEDQERPEDALSTPEQTEEHKDDVSRSDLPPQPRSAVAKPSSPYAARVAKELDKLAGVLPQGADTMIKLRGPAKAVVKNMEASLQVPTATSARTIPAKVLIENRLVINSHLARTRGGKVSFTHLIAFAIVESLVQMPSMNVRYSLVDGVPTLEDLAHVGLGLAIDVQKKDGSRQLMVPVIHNADLMNFMEFVTAYEDLVSRARNGELEMADFAGASITLTNPGTLGTVFSVPRLMQGQGAIIGVGATDYPAEWAGATKQQLARAGVGKVMNITSTYDHRVIQGAGSGEFLKILGQKLQGLDDFYGRVFKALKVPLEPFTWETNLEYDSVTEVSKPARIRELIHAFRSRGHLAADTDPLDYRVRMHPDLSLQAYGLSMWDLDLEFPTGGFGSATHLTLRTILDRLRDTYTRTVGTEYMHIQDPTQRKWMQNRIEGPYQKPSDEARTAIMRKLNQAEAFETFLQTKFVGQKRFSLEGGESLIPLLDSILEAAAHDGLYEVCIGMAHRGRLNVLANIAGKSNAQIFSEFEGHIEPGALQGSGDVKYHLGTEGVYTSDDGLETRVYLAANPSHLEAVNSVLEGIVRAKQDRIGLENDYGVLPIQIHGDAAFIGQGVVYETLNMSQVKAYRTGGTIHVIVNNQIGFTTSPTHARSTNYCTDLAKGLQVPIFHVNGDDPEMVVRVAKLAYDFREEFNKDVIIDMVCYRRRGHNEGDDPSMTQPVMYGLIDNLPSTRTVYVNNLIGRGDLTQEEAQEALDDYQKKLETILTETREHGYKPKSSTETPGLEPPESQKLGQGLMIGWQSAVPSWVLERIGDTQVAFPDGFTPHPKVKQLLEKRQKMTREGGIDWGFAGLIALGTVLMEGTPVRMSGEDSRRATFVQRHAVMHDHITGEEWTPLQFLTEDQASFEIYDSTLSEYAPLGFEYGYSVERPEALTIWEAQFGDFANGAQTIIDEFISSAEQKWGQRNSLVVLLPHGYEGQGPDHSSARIERYLQMAAEDNMFICQPSVPANYFHLLRAQTYRRPRKPLIVFTPKQLLRLKYATSPVEDFTSGVFQEVLDDTAHLESGQVTKVLLCSGRVYYDLEAERNRREDRTTAILRLEQYYPLPTQALQDALEKYGEAELVWVQDEPKNQGAWPFIHFHADELFAGRKIRVVSRPMAASPATGTVSLHKAQNATLLQEAFE